MLLGAKLVLIIPFWYRFKPTSPRDADTANTLFLVIYSAAAVCEPCDIRRRVRIHFLCAKRKGSIQPEWVRLNLLAQREGDAARGEIVIFVPLNSR